jgi:hypothetical protein
LTILAIINVEIYFSRLKDLAQKQYSQKEAELGAGRSIEQLPPAHPELKHNNFIS